MNGDFRRALGFGLLMIAASAALPASAQVVPDGGTATTVTVDGSGRTTVGIAPAGAGDISRNSFTDFSVGTAGVDLDNRLVGARTILSEVTSANRSVISGAAASARHARAFHPGQSERNHRRWRPFHQYRRCDPECRHGGASKSRAGRRTW